MKANAAMNPLDFRDDSTLFDGHCVRLDASCGPFPQRPFFENLVAGGQLTKVVSVRGSAWHMATCPSSSLSRRRSPTW